MDFSNLGVAAIATTIVAIIVTVVFFAFWKARVAAEKRTNVVLLGVSGGGKTALFLRLRKNTFISTVPSLEENCEGGLIDCPGHHSLNQAALAKLKQAKAVIFVVDAVTFAENASEAANYLYDILLTESCRANGIPVYIVLNKSDNLNAVKSSYVKRRLEKDINSLRTTRAKNIDDISSDSVDTFIGEEGKDFSFSQIKSSIAFLEVSARTESGLDKLKEVVDQYVATE
uniref:Signal recognition particle receptor subunit beta n=1 Tax=Palpitomonas bilix TaxID=652834 RepID=A0A7S3GAY7_9EUKA|mmetsp:Transcript_42596/g.109575  ORF Transcript_42596/g.109575 Transcript_42596/m.109575 type:complete len:229 (+) Transcript_42596:101-787(+)